MEAVKELKPVRALRRCVARHDTCSGEVSAVSLRPVRPSHLVSMCASAQTVSGPSVKFLALKLLILTSQRTGDNRSKLEVSCYASTASHSSNSPDGFPDTH